MIKIDYGHMVTVLGMIGSGKTVLLQWLFAKFPRAVFFDVEDMDHWEHVCPQTIVVNNLEQLFKIYKVVQEQKVPTIHIVYKATRCNYGDELTNEFDKVCSLTYDNLNYIALFCDELGMVNQLRPMDSQAPMGYANLLLRARKRKISMVGAAQRNQHIPKVQVTQSRHKFIFQMEGSDIRAYQSKGILGVDGDEVLSLPDYYCLYLYGNTVETLAPVPILRSSANVPIFYEEG